MPLPSAAIPPLSANQLHIGEAACCVRERRIGRDELDPASARQRDVEGVGRGEAVGKSVYLR